jgi:hypothetical protein
MMTSLTSGFASRLTWTHPPESRLPETVRVVTLRRSTDDQTPMMPSFAFRSAIGICTPYVWTLYPARKSLPPPVLPVPLRIATRSKIAPTSPKNGSSRCPANALPPPATEMTPFAASAR